MKLAVSQSPHLNKQLFQKNDVCFSPLKKVSPSKSRSKKSLLEVTCKNKCNSQKIIPLESPVKNQKMLCRAGNEKMIQIDKLMENLTLREPKTQSGKKKPNLLMKTELLQFYSLTTIDSMQMRRSNIGLLWGCDSPVNKLSQFE